MTQAPRDVALIITPRYLPMLGGMERECALLAREYTRRGWHTVIVTEQLGEPLPVHEIDEHGVEIHRIPSSAQRSLAVQLRVAAAMARHVLRHRRRARFAIVRTATLPAVLIGALKALRLIRFPTLMTAETGGDEDDVVALSRRPLFGVSRTLVSAHDRLNGICRANVEHLRELGFPEGKISFIPNGVDISAWRSTEPPSHVRSFLFLGRIERAKGIFELAEAFAALRSRQPDVTLSVAGAGPDREALEARLDELGAAGGARFLGRVPYAQLGEVFAAHDCLVLPSYSEGMPLSLLEAAAHHRIMVIADVGDVRELFGERVHLCPPRDAAALEAAMEAAAADEAPRADYAEIVERVSIESVAGELLASLGVAA